MRGCVGCMPSSGAGFVPLLFLLAATFKPLHDGRLHPFKLPVTLHVARIEIDGEVQMVATQTAVNVHPQLWCSGHAPHASRAHSRTRSTGSHLSPVPCT